MYNRLIQSATFAFTLALSPVVLAHSNHCGESLKHMVDSLKLDDSQKAKIKPVLEQFKATIKNDASQMKDLNQQINQQVESANIDQSAVDSLIDKKAKLIGDIMKAKVTAKVQILGVLNPQQKTEVQDKMKKMEEQMKEKYSHCHEE